MAKLTFTKLGLKKKGLINTISYNSQDIDIKQYLPFEEKIELINDVVNLSRDDNNFINPARVELMLTIKIIMAYTNITFTEKQQEDYVKLYDLFAENDLTTIIMDNIPDEEINFIVDTTWDSLEQIYTYNNSALGMIETLKNNYDNLAFDAEKLQTIIKDPNSLTLLKDVLAKLG